MFLEGCVCLVSGSIPEGKEATDPRTQTPLPPPLLFLSFSFSNIWHDVIWFLYKIPVSHLQPLVCIQLTKSLVKPPVLLIVSCYVTTQKSVPSLLHVAH